MKWGKDTVKGDETLLKIFLRRKGTEQASFVSVDGKMGRLGIEPELKEWNI